MQSSGILGSAIGYGASRNVGGVTAAAGSPAGFADWLAASDRAAREQAIMKERVAAVGLAAYGREQQEMQKLGRVLNLVQAETPVSIRAILDNAIADIRDDPPATPTEMADRVATCAAEALIGAPKEIAEQIETMMERVAELMQRPDDALAELEGLAWRRKSVGRA